MNQQWLSWDVRFVFLLPFFYACTEFEGFNIEKREKLNCHLIFASFILFELTGLLSQQQKVVKLDKQSFIHLLVQTWICPSRQM